MTFDPTSSLARRQDPESIRNFRIPALDLDSLYGGGPGVSPALYDQQVDHGRTTMLVEEIPGSAAVTVNGQPRYDLPRNSQNVAILGDPRNDENLIVSQLHLAMLRFHNAVVGRRQGRSRCRADRGGGVRRGPADRALALPVDDRARVPAQDRRRCDHGRHRGQRPEVLRLAARPVHPGGVLGGGVPVRALAGAAQLPGQLRHQCERCRSAVLRHDLRPHAARSPTIRPICAGAAGRRAGTSTGRPSSTSPTAGSGPTS